MKLETRLRWVRAGGLYDLLVTWPLLLPWTQAAMVEQLRALNTDLGLAGQLPALDGFHSLLASLLATLVLIWGWARWRYPSERLGSWDALTRLGFGSWLVLAAFSGLPRLLLVYAAMEALFGLMQWAGLRHLAPAAAAPRYPAASHS